MTQQSLFRLRVVETTNAVHAWSLFHTRVTFLFVSADPLNLSHFQRDVFERCLSMHRVARFIASLPEIRNTKYKDSESSPTSEFSVISGHPYRVCNTWTDP